MHMQIITYPQVAELARKKQLSINQLAKDAGLARSVLDRWRTGKSAPTLRTVEKIRRALTEHPNTTPTNRRAS